MSWVTVKPDSLDTKAIAAEGPSYVCLPLNGPLKV